jgi:CBS domain-containing protein
MTVQGILMRKGARVYFAHHNTRVADALDKMLRARIGALVVSRASPGLEGLVTERDIIRSLATEGVRQCLRLTVGDIMSRPVRTCGPDDSLRRVLTTMTRRRVRHMPVVKDGNLCGIVSIGDVVKHRLEEAETEARVAREAFVIAR